MWAATKPASPTAAPNSQQLEVLLHTAATVRGAEQRRREVGSQVSLTPCPCTNELAFVEVESKANCRPFNCYALQGSTNNRYITCQDAVVQVEASELQWACSQRLRKGLQGCREEQGS